MSNTEPQGWQVRRATAHYRRLGNRDLYLYHSGGAQGAVYPIGGEAGARRGPWRAMTCAGTRDFARQRDALAHVKATGVAAYEGADR